MCGKEIWDSLSQVEHLSDGTISEVYVGVNKRNNIAYVVKIQETRFKRPPHDAIRGRNILKDLKHPHIQRLLGSFSEPSTSCLHLITEYKPFVLSEISNKLPKNVKINIVSQLADALQYLENNGILHRDIHPNNVLLASEEGPAYLTDFSIAWSEEYPGDEKEELISQIGTGHYRAIETLFGCRTYRHEVDRWSFGVLIAELFADAPLFDDGSSEGWPSELRLISNIFQTLGTPNVEMWPELANCPDWNKFIFHEYPPKPWENILPNTDSTVRKVVSKLVNYPNRASPAYVIDNIHF
ncbi:cyclin-dependent kinase activating kinase Csk1 [Schizosaccharomyces osmophilus]|uniref:Cyclin-dependent kinase activating kinase Csk1 n=1 Tax=Schizosaccharomyces osmophilus TaxID=2545709 RepID=A0AAF0AUY1_9SCHI|nr:cyclin-dependent kinase activating kinase Csk1 [Schizosaccharomyces osmophilus]WBW71838.1 cyclin-dependent kinase activating kinase Csk1 [Schizosaccharomyces osmophilus]